MKKTNLSIMLIFLSLTLLLSSCGSNSSNNSVQNAETRMPSVFIANFPDSAMEIKGYKSPITIEYLYHYPENDIESETVGNANTYYTVSYLPDDPKAVFSFYQQLLGDTKSSPYASGTIGKYDIFVDYSRSPEITIVFESFENEMMENETFDIISKNYIPSKYFEMYYDREIQINIQTGKLTTSICYVYKGDEENLAESYKNQFKNSQVNTENKVIYIAGDEKDSKFLCDVQIYLEPQYVRFSAIEQIKP